MSGPSRSPSQNSVLTLFPETAELSPSGGITVGGVALDQLAERFGTPAHVVDVETFRRQARRFVRGLAQRWPNSEVLFASKSFPAMAMYRLAADEGLSIDVAGGGEIELALAAGVDAARLYFHGNAKTDAELSRALEAGVGTVIVDNADELDRLQRLATRPLPVLVRVIPNVSPQTHPSQSTGGHDSKFGLPLGQARPVMDEIERSEFLTLEGLHLHIGSQVLAASPFGEAVREVAQIGGLHSYNVGGGLGVRYTYAEHPPSVEEYLDAIAEAARAVLPASARLLIEPGRALVARAGLTLYRIVTVKRTGRNFVALDGGMADNLDIALTGQRYEAAIVDRPSAPGTLLCDVVGRQCESGDLMIGGIELPDPAVGDLLAMPVTGAYSFTMANNYNGAYKPPVVFVQDGEARVVVRRETVEDLLRLHVGV